MEDDLVVAGEMAVVALDGDRSCTSDASIHLIFNILDASRALSTPYKTVLVTHKLYSELHHAVYATYILFQGTKKCPTVVSKTLV